MDLEIRRQLIHSLGILNIVPILVLGKFHASLFMLGMALVFIIFAEYRKKRLVSKLLKVKHVKSAEKKIDEEIMSYERMTETPMNGAFMFYLGVFFVTVVFESRIAIASIAVLSMADSISTLVGYYFGSHKLFLNKKKSWEGSLAFFATAFFVLVFFINPIKAFIIALLVALVEAAPKINDNLSVPISTGLLLSIMINI